MFHIVKFTQDLVARDVEQANDLKIGLDNLASKWKTCRQRFNQPMADPVHVLPHFVSHTFDDYEKSEKSKKSKLQTGH